MAAQTFTQIAPPADRTLVDQVVRQLRTSIILGQLEPGERLLELPLAQQLGVARSTLREALRRLEAESLVESESHRGSRVARLDPADAVEIAELRVLLEARAVQHMRLPIDGETRDQLCQIVAQIERLRIPGDASLFIDLDDAFHRTIVAASGGRRLYQVWNGVSSLVSVLVGIAMQHTTNDGPAIAARHRQIVEALSQTDPVVAREAIEHHYRSLVERIRQIMQLQTTNGATDR